MTKRTFVSALMSAAITAALTLVPGVSVRSENCALRPAENARRPAKHAGPLRA